MPTTDSIADRAWLAYQCLPRDKAGNLPSVRTLEDAYDLSRSMLSRLFSGERTKLQPATWPKVALALRAPTIWLMQGEGKGPTIVGALPPLRPGTKRMKHGDHPDWYAAAEQGEALKLVQPEAYLAGADLPMFRQIEVMTPKLATWIAGYAWETSTRQQQARYSTQYARQTFPGHTRKTLPLRMQR